jgi:hypothetical protein
MNKNKRVKENFVKCVEKRRLFFKSTLKQMEIACNINKAKTLIKNWIVNENDSNHKHCCLGIRKVGNKKKLLPQWSEYYEKHLELQDVTYIESGEVWTMCV